MTTKPFDLDALLIAFPLPWAAWPYSITGGPVTGWYVSAANAAVVASWAGDPGSELTARLLAAAPGMMKAIQEAVQDDASGSPLDVRVLRESLP